MSMGVMVSALWALDRLQQNITLTACCYLSRASLPHPPYIFFIAITLSETLLLNAHPKIERPRLLRAGRAVLRSPKISSIRNKGLWDSPYFLMQTNMLIFSI